MKNNYLISGIPILDNNAQGKGFLDISLEDVKFSEDHSDIIAGKVTAQAIGYTDGEEFDPIVFEGTDVSLTGAGGGGMEDFQEVSVEIIPTVGGEPLNKTITENSLECGSSRDYSPAIDNMVITTTGNANIGKLPILKNGDTLLLNIFFVCSDESVYFWVKNVTPTITGDAEYIPQDGGNPAKIKIWGDCALTIEVEPE